MCQWSAWSWCQVPSSPNGTLRSSTVTTTYIRSRGHKVGQKWESVGDRCLKSTPNKFSAMSIAMKIWKWGEVAIVHQGGGVDKSKHNTRSSIGKHWASSYEMGCMGIGEMASGRMMLVHMWNVQADLGSTAEHDKWNVYEGQQLKCIPSIDSWICLVCHYW